MMRHILEEIIGGMRTPERPSSPIDAYITEEEIFRRCNPKVRIYHTSQLSDSVNIFIYFLNGVGKSGL